jgi:hypothetical protein
LRKHADLPEIKTVNYNILFDRARYEERMKQDCQLVRYHSLGLYLFLARVVQPLLCLPSPPQHDHPLNAVAAKLVEMKIGADQFTSCDYAGVYVWRKNK